MLLFLLLTLSCSVRKRNCNTTNFKELNLQPVHCVLKLPEYKILDSIRYDNQTILSYTIKSTDSLLNMNCFIRTYETDSTLTTDFNTIKIFQKQEAEFNRESIRLLTDTTSDIGAIKVGYLKYLVQTTSEKFYEARIFFLKERYLVSIWLFEKYKDEEQNKSSLIDCVLGTIKLK